MSKENNKALQEGSLQPPEIPGFIRLYGMRFCPYAERIRLLLKHLKKKFEVININTNSKPQWFLDLNPDGTVPVVEYKSVILNQSLVCLEFLNEEFGKSKLLSKKPLDRAVQRIMMERFDKIATPIGNIAKTAEVAVHRENVAKIHKELEPYETFLEGSYFGNKAPNLLDFAFWPWFERFPSLTNITSLTILPDTFPKLTNWVENMKKLEIVKQTMLPDDLHSRYFQLKQTGSKDVDMVNLGLEESSNV